MPKSTSLNFGIYETIILESYRNMPQKGSFFGISTVAFWKSMHFQQCGRQVSDKFLANTHDGIVGHKIHLKLSQSHRRFLFGHKKRIQKSAMKYEMIQHVRKMKNWPFQIKDAISTPKDSQTSTTAFVKSILLRVAWSARWKRSKASCHCFWRPPWWLHWKIPLGLGLA